MYLYREVVQERCTYGGRWRLCMGGVPREPDGGGAGAWGGRRGGVPRDLYGGGAGEVYLGTYMEVMEGRCT